MWNYLPRNFERWMEITSFHGFADILQEKGIIWRLFWVLTMIAMTVLSILMIYPLIIQYQQKIFYTRTSERSLHKDDEHRKEFGVFLYCSDDWLNLSKVIERKENTTALLYALSLLQPLESKSLMLAEGLLRDLHGRSLTVGSRITEWDSVFDSKRDNDSLFHPGSIWQFQRQIVDKYDRRPNLIKHLTLNDAGNYELFDLANDFTVGDIDDAQTAECRKSIGQARLKSLGYSIRNGRVCQKLSFVDHIVFGSSTAIFPKAKICILHDRRNYKTTATRHFSFYTENIEGIEPEDVDDDKYSVMKFNLVSDHHMTSKYSVTMEKFIHIDRKQSRCSHKRLYPNYPDLGQAERRFPAFLDYEIYCKYQCENLMSGYNVTCTKHEDQTVGIQSFAFSLEPAQRQHVIKCQQCVPVYSVLAHVKGIYPCQTNFVHSTSTGDALMPLGYNITMVPLGINSFQQCYDKLMQCHLKPCTVYSYKLAQLEASIVSVLPTAYPESFSSAVQKMRWNSSFGIPWYNYTSCMRVQTVDGVPEFIPQMQLPDRYDVFINHPSIIRTMMFNKGHFCTGMFEDIIEFKMPLSYTEHRDLELYTVGGLTSQIGGNLGLFLGASWVTFIQVIAYVCCCRCECCQTKTISKIVDYEESTDLTVVAVIAK